MSQQKRGQVTERIKAKSQELMGYEIDRGELRLMPYIVYTMMNDQRIDREKINQDERKILNRWRQAGYIEGGAEGLQITKKFWDILVEICFLAYVDIDG